MRDGEFVYECVTYDDNCPNEKYEGAHSQQPLPAGIAQGATFSLLFLPNTNGSGPLTLVPAAAASLELAPPTIYTTSALASGATTFKALAPGPAEIEVIDANGTVVNHTFVNVVVPAALELRERIDGPLIPTPYAMVPMGQMCIYAVSLGADNVRIAGMLTCSASAPPSQQVVRVGTEFPGVFCLNGESYGEATVTVTCESTVATLPVVVAKPGAPDAGTD